MLELNIERLQLQINDASGHEHRIAGIAQRAASLLAEQILLRYDGARGALADQVDTLSARPVDANLGATGDEEMARNIANAWFEALALRLRA